MGMSVPLASENPIVGLCDLVISEDGDLLRQENDGDSFQVDISLRTDPDGDFWKSIEAKLRVSLADLSKWYIPNATLDILKNATWTPLPLTVNEAFDPECVVNGQFIIDRKGPTGSRAEDMSDIDDLRVTIPLRRSGPDETVNESELVATVVKSLTPAPQSNGITVGDRAETYWSSETKVQMWARGIVLDYAMARPGGNPMSFVSTLAFIYRWFDSQANDWDQTWQWVDIGGGLSAQENVYAPVNQDPKDFNPVIQEGEKTREETETIVSAKVSRPSGKTGIQWKLGMTKPNESPPPNDIIDTTGPFSSVRTYMW